MSIFTCQINHDKILTEDVHLIKGFLKALKGFSTYSLSAAFGALTEICSVPSTEKREKKITDNGSLWSF